MRPFLHWTRLWRSVPHRVWSNPHHTVDCFNESLYIKQPSLLQYTLSIYPISMSSSPLPHSFHLHSPLSLPLPFLCQALKALNKKDLSEVKAYNNPPEQVETVMQAVMILKQSEPTWAEAKRQLGEANFIKQLVEFDKDNMSDKTLKRIGQYCARPDFKPDIVGRVSLAAKSLCMWVGAMEVYGRIFRVVEPKKKVCLCARGCVFSINCFFNHCHSVDYQQNIVTCKHIL